MEIQMKLIYRDCNGSIGSFRNTIKMAVDDVYRYFEGKCIKTGPIDYNDFELVNEKLKVKGALSIS